jgi:AcrR family transcriptional regulator
VSYPAYRRAEPDARKQSLIEACERVLARVGAAGASVRTIAIEAGVSPGLINHHFGSVDALVTATYEHVDAKVSNALNDAVDAAGPDPRDRLTAFVTASFALPIADPALLATWIAFWSLVRARADVARLHDEQYSAYRATIETLLGDCGLAEGERRLAAIALSALVDGLWLELCLSPDNFTADEARGIAERQVASYFNATFI